MTCGTGRHGGHVDTCYTVYDLSNDREEWIYLGVTVSVFTLWFFGPTVLWQNSGFFQHVLGVFLYLMADRL